MEGDSPVEVLKHQVLKYQFPSPFSLSRGVNVSERFKVRPFRFLLKLLADDRISYLTEEEIAKIIITEAISELKKEQAKASVQPDHPEDVPGETSAAGAGSSVSNTPPASNTSLPTYNLQTEIDPNAAAKYVERCNTCCKTISTTFFELTTALTNLTHLDAKLKEEKRKEAQKLLETIAETIKEWPPAKKPLKVIH